MNKMSFVKGMGVGMVVGSAIGMAAAPKNRKGGVGKAIKSIGSAIENVTDMLGLG